jgi:hypothetical protein
VSRQPRRKTAWRDAAVGKNVRELEELVVVVGAVPGILPHPTVHTHGA